MTPELIVRPASWAAAAAASDHYARADPFPHLVLDDFLANSVAEQAAAEFPDATSSLWRHYVHFNEDKLGLSDVDALGPGLRAVFEALLSPHFVRFLAEVTGIGALLADPSLEGGGLHLCRPGGHLNIHTDFSIHPHQPRWRRRLNLLVYLNKDWRDDYQGHLELWDRDVKRCVRRIAPSFNRCVIFDTTGAAYHGHPEPVACPAGNARKSLALYYFSDDAPGKPVRSTDYRSRPGDGIRRAALIFADKLAVRIYDRAKRRLAFSDRVGTTILRQIDRLRGRG